MKNKQFISAVMAVAMVATSMTAFSAFADDDKEGNHMSDAIPVSFGKELTDQQLYRLDDDWYSFSLDTTSKVHLYTKFNFYQEYNGTYYEIVDADNDYKTIFKSENLKPVKWDKDFYLPAGNYFIHVCSESQNFSANYDMNVTVATPEEDSFDALSNNNLGNASAIKFDTEYTGHLYDNDEVDYYTFNLAEEGMVTLNLDSSMDNVDWKIYNSDKVAVEEGTFSKSDNNEEDSGISAKKSYIMTAGTFTIGIMKNDKSEKAYGNYTLKLDYLKDYNNYHASGVFACADINKDGFIDAGDATVVLSYYAYLSTGGKESDLNVWYNTEFAE
ncbi:MAG: hypothetical protein K2J39_13115 [Ruminococcus sp.]|nr:hypothetical protein [Ruminococcus sp.]